MVRTYISLSAFAFVSLGSQRFYRKFKLTRYRVQGEEYTSNINYYQLLSSLSYRYELFFFNLQIRVLI